MTLRKVLRKGEDPFLSPNWKSDKKGNPGKSFSGKSKKQKTKTVE